MATIDYQPWYQGQTYPAWDIPLNAGGVSDNITGISIATFTLTFRAASGLDTLGTGTFSVKQNNPAEVYYQPSAADVAAVFSGTLIIKALSADGRTIVWDPIGGATPSSSFMISAS